MQMQALNAHIEYGCVTFPERLILPRLDRRADALHERIIKIQIMHHGKAHGQHLFRLEQVPQIGAGIPPADRSVALRVDRLLIALIFLIFNVDDA